MTMQNVLSFGTAIETDEALRAELAHALAGKTGEHAMAATADFATAHGYPMTTQEVATGYNALEKVQQGDTEELSDAEMEIVSGGKDTGNSSKHNSPFGRSFGSFFNGFFG